MPQRALTLCLALAVLLCGGLIAPGPAFAWGPGVHMMAGNWILQNLGVLPAAVAMALMRHPGQFLHGSLSADIFVGKGSKPKKGHSHNWESGFALLERAASPQTRAYACGYLAHLAADTVAHNVFVPLLLGSAPGPCKLAHVYLESQADRMLDWDKEDALRVFRGRTSRRTDTLLRRSLNKSPLVFRVQSGLYRSGIAVSGSSLWRRSLRLVDAALCGRAPCLLWARPLESLIALSTRAAFSVLLQGRLSPVLELDPIGAAALAGAGEQRPADALSDALPGILPEALQRLPRICATFSPPPL